VIRRSGSSPTAGTLEAFWVLQVEGHRPLVAVQDLEVRPLARAARLFAGGVIHEGSILMTLAPQSASCHTGRSGADPGEIEHGKERKG